MKKSEIVKFLQDVVVSYPEMSWLTGDVQATPDASVDAQEGKTFGEVLFPNFLKDSLIELNRTAVGLATLKWVMENDYKSFTDCQKNNKMSLESFQELREYTKKVLPTEEAFDAMVIYTVINDLGKVQVVVDKAKELGISNVDHDKVLIAMLEKFPQISPSYDSLKQYYKDMILNGLRAEFNIGQFVQAENVPASLNKLIGLDRDSMDFYLLHALYDVAGAAGQFVQNGSVVMNEPTYQSFQMGVHALAGLNNGKNVQEAYNDYLTLKSSQFGIDMQNAFNKMIVRLCCMLRVFEQEIVQEVVAVIQDLKKDRNTQNVVLILEKEMNKSGTNDGFATLVYYAPAFLVNLTKGKVGADFKQSLKSGLLFLAHLYQEARISIRKRNGNGVFTVMANKVAQVATQGSEFLLQHTIQIKAVDDDAEAEVVPVCQISKDVFTKYSSLSEVIGNRVVAIGMGGGSDGIQAAVLLKLLQKSSKDCPCVISVRSSKTSSQSPEGKTDEKRNIKNHAGEIYTSVYEVTPETSGSGRFLENIPADSVKSFLIVEQKGILTEQIMAVLKHVGNVDTVIGIDTGGDALYPFSSDGHDQTKTTPDQDLRVLSSIDRLTGVKTYSCEIAVGVDSPDNAEEVLLNASAVYYELNDVEMKMLFNQYRSWRMDGSDDSRFGKTPLSWQMALNGNTGIVAIPLPSRVVLDENNPWRTFVSILSVTKGLFFMETKNHLLSINNEL